MHRILLIFIVTIIILFHALLIWTYISEYSTVQSGCPISATLTLETVKLSEILWGLLSETLTVRLSTIPPLSGFVLGDIVVTGVSGDGGDGGVLGDGVGWWCAG